MNEVLNAIKSRRSVRSFRPEQIKQEELDLIIEAGIYAPTAHNGQPWHFTIIQDEDVIRHISDVSKEVMAGTDIGWIKALGTDPEFHVSYKAPTLIIVSGRTSASTWRDECAAAIENMLIAAQSMGIGSIWLGLAVFCFKKEGEAEKIGIPAGYEPYAGVALGYKLDDLQTPVPKRNYNVVNYIR